MESDQQYETEPPSKSQRKREAHQLQELGVKLTNFSEPQLRQLPVPDKIVNAITEYNRLPNRHGARRRQLQFIGKLMRDCDYEPLNDAVLKFELGKRTTTRTEPISSTWAQKILHSGDSEINAVLELNSTLERQKIRQLYREFHTANEETRDSVHSRLQEYLQAFLD